MIVGEHGPEIIINADRIKANVITASKISAATIAIIDEDGDWHFPTTQWRLICHYCGRPLVIDPNHGTCMRCGGPPPAWQPKDAVMSPKRQQCPTL